MDATHLEDLDVYAHAAPSVAAFYMSGPTKRPRVQLDARTDSGPLDPDGDTWACPRCMSANDGNGYAVKMPGSGNSRSFFNEFLAANIARMAGLFAAEPAVVNASGEPIGRSPDLQAARALPGPHFATRHRRGACTASGRMRLRIQPELIANLKDVPSFAVFDVPVHNTDRHGGNTLLVPSDGGRPGCQCMLIDHGHGLGGPCRDHGTASSMPYKLAGVPWRTDSAAGTGDFAGPAGRLTRLDAARIDGARSGLLGEWAMPADDYEALRCAPSSGRPNLILDAVRAGGDRLAGLMTRLGYWQGEP